MIAATVLAAGNSSRMGRPKALLDLAGRTFLETIVAKLDEVEIDMGYVVLGNDRRKILQGSDLGLLEPIENSELAAGPVGSIRSVLRKIGPDVDGLLVWPVDMPRVRTETLKALITMVDGGKPIVLPVHSGERGHPLVIRREIFQEILQLSQHETLKSVVRSDSARVHPVSVDDPAVLDSINTPEDYERIIGGGV